MNRRRSTERELMDDLTYKGADLEVTLHELDFINRWLGGEKISLDAISTLVESTHIRSFVDLGCGSGSIPAKVKNKYPLIAVEGIDANPNIIDYARSIHTDVRFQCQNIFEETFAKKHYDIIHCCLFLHHFTDEELIRLFSQFKKQARVGIVINDLHRHPFAFWSISILTSLFSGSRLVKHDARLSVARGFKRSEIHLILDKAGISKYQLKWKWAFRWQLIILTG